MRTFYLLPLLFCQLIFSKPVYTQEAISIDLGAIRAKNHHHAGLNVSAFYHFNEHLLGGIEVNRFFPVNKVISDESLQLSAWDLEMNFHYLMNLGKVFRLYPIAGIGHSKEKEMNSEDHQKNYHQSWAVNTGMGLYARFGHWLPHIEYIFSWGELNQEFILIGAGYEISWGHNSEKK